jgi:heat shock protein HslJ
MNTMLKLAALIGAAWLAACASVGKVAAPAPAVDLWGSEWRLEDLDGRAVLDNTQPGLAFPEPDTAAGNGSCNRFFGTVEVKGEAVKFGKLATTRRLCPEAVAGQEAEYLQALENAGQIRQDGEQLLIVSQLQGKPLTLRFVRARPAQP